MSYNGSGTFVINTSGQPVVTGTVISSTAFNALTADLGTGLSTAITKDGQTTTTAKIPFAAGLSAAVASNFAAGTVSAPAIYLSTDTGTGLYRIGANNDGFAISGTKLLDFGSALLGITGAATISTTLGVTGATTLSSTLAAGNTTITGTLQVSTGAAVGGATAGAGGLAFPATAVAVANANTLDDYEEGTWTPSIGGTATYTTQSGIYTRIGNQVTVGWEIDISVIGTGSATIMSGMPFTNRNGYYTAAPLSYWSNLGSSVTFLGGQVQSNGTTMNFVSGNASSNTCSSPTTVFGSGARIIGSVTYIV